MTKRIFTTAAALLLLSSTAWAQNPTSGTVEITGRVESTLSLVFHDAALTDVTGNQTAAANRGDALAFIMEVGDVGDLTRPALVGGTITVALRGNNGATAFRMTGETILADAILVTNVGDASALGLDDIAFGVGTLAAGGLAGPGAAAAVAAGPLAHAYDPWGAGAPPWASNLNSLYGAGPVDLVGATGQLSASGGLADDNALYVPLHFVIQPAMYAPLASFSATAEFTVVSP